MKKMWAIWGALLISTGAWAQQNFDQCKEQFAFGFVPKVVDNPKLRLRALCFNSFAVLHSGASKTPLYSAEFLTRERLQDAKDEQRTNMFYEEGRLPKAERAVLNDYKGSGFDRGHLAPAANMPNPNAMAQSFSLANMVPQASVHNRELWADIERDTRKYVQRTGSEVYVITGPIFAYPSDAQVQKIGSGVWVPTHLFKLVYDKTQGRAWAHLSENQNGTKMQRPISYQQLVQYTGIEFLAPGALR